MRKVLVIICTIFIMLLLVACDSKVDDHIEQPTDVLRLNLSTQIQAIDPAYAQSGGELLLSRLVYSTLVDTKDGHIVGDAADSWELSEDGLTYLFRLKRDILFHNGKEMTSEDVKFSLERLLRLTTPTAYILDHVQGTESIQKGEKTLSGIKIIDDYTFSITLTEKQEDFLTYLSLPAASILDKQELVDHGADYALPSTSEKAYALPSGTGPYRLGEYCDGKVVSLGAFADYFAGEPKVERIEFPQDIDVSNSFTKLESDVVDVVQDAFTLLPAKQQGESIDETLEVEKEAALSEDFIKIERPVHVIRYLAINSSKEPFNNEALRKAIFSAVSGNDLVKRVRGGYGICPAEGVSNYWYDLSTNTPARGYDTEVAKARFAEAGFTDGKGLPILTLMCGPNEEDIKIAKTIASDLNKVGCRVIIETKSYRELRTAVRQGTAAFYIGKFVDKGGGLDIFFKEVVDADNQGVIGKGSWYESLNHAYSAEESIKMEEFSQVEKSLTGQGILLCLYYEISDYTLKKSWSSLALDDSGVLDLSEVLTDK
ncbi:MAG: ABC transporter substrate-binding protein [Bacillota bacterium]